MHGISQVTSDKKVSLFQRKMSKPGNINSLSTAFDDLVLSQCLPAMCQLFDYNPHRNTVYVICHWALESTMAGTHSETLDCTYLKGLMT